jgi:hypothetical protein
MDPRMSVDGFEDTPKTIRCVNGWLSRASVMVRVMDTVYDPKSAIPSGGPEHDALAIARATFRVGKTGRQKS